MRRDAVRSAPHVGYWNEGWGDLLRLATLRAWRAGGVVAQPPRPANHSSSDFSSMLSKRKVLR